LLLLFFLAQFLFPGLAFADIFILFLTHPITSLINRIGARRILPR
jgi:hypothetical protein